MIFTSSSVSIIHLAGFLVKNLNGLNTELERNGDFPQNLPVIAAEKTPDPPGQTWPIITVSS